MFWEGKLLNHRVAARKVDLAPEKTATVWIQAEIERSLQK
jgi:hypothetical protein